MPYGAQNYRSDVIVCVYLSFDLIVTGVILGCTLADVIPKKALYDLEIQEQAKKAYFEPRDT